MAYCTYKATKQIVTAVNSLRNISLFVSPVADQTVRS
jgi:hypothetical protein